MAVHKHKFENELEIDGWVNAYCRCGYGVAMPVMVWRTRQAAQGIVDAAPAALAAIRGAQKRLEEQSRPWYAKLWRRIAGSASDG